MWVGGVCDNEGDKVTVGFGGVGWCGRDVNREMYVCGLIDVGE